MKKPANHSARAHARYSPSKLKSLEICPVFRDDPDRPPHFITVRGTFCHEALDSNDDHLLFPDERPLVQMCRDYMQTWVGWKRHDEVRLETPGGQFGFADRVFVSEPKAVLVDFKFSTQLQEDAESNPAAQAYTCGIFKNWPGVDEVEVHYIYPRLHKVSTATYRRGEDLTRIHLRCETIVERARHADPEQDAVPVEEVCLYCANKATCTALHKLALPLANRYRAEELKVPVEYDPQFITDPTVMSRALAVAAVMAEWSDSVRYHANKLRRESGVEIPGYAWTHRKGDTSVLNPLAVVAKAREFGLDDADIMSACEVSLSKIAEKIMERADRGKKAKLAQQFRDELEDSGVVEQKPETWFLKKEKKK